MKTPDSSLKIMAAFQRAVKSGDTVEIDQIPLKDIKLARAHLVCDSKQPFYVFMSDYVQEREKAENKGANEDKIKKENVIFISHINEEKSLALLLKNLLTSNYPEIPVFVSSDYESIQSGKEWYDVILENARSAKVVIVMLSKQSAYAPWINFESGIGAGTNGEVVPVVCRNIKIDDIPPPLKFRQARDLRDTNDVSACLRDIARIFNQTEPKGDWSNFTRELATAIKCLPYHGLCLEPYLVSSDNGRSFVMLFKLINNGTIDMNLIAVEGSVLENILLNNWKRPSSIPNLSDAKIEDVNGEKRFRYVCYVYDGPIPPGHGYPPRLPGCLTPSMSPHEFPTLRFAIRADLSENELNQVVQYKIMAKEFVTETNTMTIRELLNKNKLNQTRT